MYLYICWISTLLLKYLLSSLFYILYIFSLFSHLYMYIGIFLLSFEIPDEPPCYVWYFGGIFLLCLFLHIFNVLLTIFLSRVIYLLYLKFSFLLSSTSMLKIYITIHNYYSSLGSISLKTPCYKISLIKSTKLPHSFIKIDMYII